MPATDLELLARYIADQDAEAFAELVSRHRDMVYATCYRVSWSAVDAEDAAQECFVNLARGAASIQASVAGWLHRVAVRTATAALQKDRSRQRREEEVAAMAMTPDEGPLWEEIRPEVDRAIDRLPDALRQPLVLHFLEGKDQAAIAAELRLSQSAVSRRIKKAVDQLRKHLSEKGIVVSTAVLATLLATETGSTAPATLVAALGRLSLAGVSPVPVPPPVALTGAVRAAIAGWQGKAVCLIAAAVVGHALFRQTTRGDLTAPRQHTPSRISAAGVPALARSADRRKMAYHSSPSPRRPFRELRPDIGHGRSGQETRSQPTIPSIRQAAGPEHRNSNPTRPRRTPKMKRTMKQIAVAGLLAAAPVAHTQPLEQPAFAEQVKELGKPLSDWTGREPKNPAARTTLGAAPAIQEGRERESVEDRGGQSGAVQRGPVASDILRRAQGKRVSISQPKISVQGLLDEVSKQVGLPLQVDDLLKYQKLIIYIDDYPFGSFQKALSTLLDATWVAVEDEKRKGETRQQGEGDAKGVVGDALRLVPSEHRRSVEQQLSEARKELLAEQLRSKVEAWARGDISHRLVVDESGAERATLYNEYKARAQILSLIPPEAWQGALNGDSVEFPVSEMKGELQKAIREFARRIAMPVSGGWEPNAVDNAVLVVESRRYHPKILRENPGLTLFNLGFALEIQGNRASDYSIVVDPLAFREALFDRAVQLGAIPEKNDHTRDPQGVVVSRPLPRELATWQVENVGIGQALEKIHRAMGVAVLSDYYSGPPAPMLNFQGENLSALFDTVGEVFNRSWRHVEHCTVFRSRSWWLEEALELPEERAAEWREKYNKAKAWDEETIVEMFTLSVPQMERLLKLLPEASRVADSYPLLHLYAALTSEERAKAHSPAGLSLSEVPAATKGVFSQASGANPLLVNSSGIKQILRTGNLKVTVVGTPSPRIDFLFTADDQPDQHDHQHEQHILPVSSRLMSVPLALTEASPQTPATAQPGAKPTGEN